MNIEEAIKCIQESDNSEEFDANRAESEEMDEIVSEPMNNGENDDNFESDFELEDMPYVESKDGERWYHNPTMTNRRTCNENIFRAVQGFSAKSRSKSSTSYACLSNCLNTQMLEVVVKCINEFIDVVLRHTLPVFTGLGWCPIVSWDFAGAVSIFGPDALPVVHQ